MCESELNFTGLSTLEKPSWLCSFQTQLSSSDQVPTNATGKDPGHHTMVIIILCNYILHNISDQIVAEKTRRRDPEKTSAKIAMAMMREVALRRRGNAMAMCDGDKARMCTANNTGAGTTAEQLAHTCCAVGVNESARAAGLIKKIWGEWERDQRWQMHLFPVSPDPLGLDAMVMNADIDARDVKPSGIDAHG